MKGFGKKFPGCFLAGGAILSRVTKKPIVDYDLYPKNNDAMITALSYLMEDLGGYVMSVSDKAVTIKTDEIGDDDKRLVYQVIIFDEGYPTAESIFEKFDFTINMGAWDYDEEKFIFHDKFFEDVASRTVRFNPNTDFPIASMIRLIKYREKGYKIPKMEMLKMSITVGNSDLPKSWEDVEKSLGGYYGRTVEHFNTDKEFSVENLFEIIDEMADVDLSLITEDEQPCHNISFEELVLVLDKNIIRYFPYNDNKDIMIFSKDGIMRHINSYSNTIADMFEKDNWVPINENSILRMYKLFAKTDDGKLIAPIYKNSNIVYEEGKMVRHEVYPYLFSANTSNGKIPTYVTNKTHKIIGYEVREVFTTVGSIKRITPQNIQSDSLWVGNVNDDEVKYPPKLVDMNVWKLLSEMENLVSGNKE